jgi:uncharacterized protein (DUF1697 family)
MSVGAAGTFVVQKPISQAKLRQEFGRHLPFTTEAMICSGNEVLQLASAECFSAPCGPDVVRFVSILTKRPHALPPLPISLPADGDWLVRIVAIQGRFALGMYRRNLRTIRLLGKLEKHLGGSITTRNWNTLSSLFKILRTPRDSKSTEGGPARSVLY